MKKLKDMSSPMWGWREAVAASGETSTGLRSLVQRGVVEMATTKTGRTEVKLFDAAVLPVSRHLRGLGFEAKSAFGIAKVVVKKIFEAENSDRSILHAIIKRTPHGPVGPRLLAVTPGDLEQLKEISVVVSDPHNVVVPVQPLLRDAFYTLPNMPADLAKWCRGVSATLDALQSKAGIIT